MAKPEKERGRSKRDAFDQRNRRQTFRNFLFWRFFVGLACRLPSILSTGRREGGLAKKMEGKPKVSFYLVAPSQAAALHSVNSSFGWGATFTKNCALRKERKASRDCASLFSRRFPCWFLRLQRLILVVQYSGCKKRKLWGFIVGRLGLLKPTVVSRNTLVLTP